MSNAEIPDNGDEDFSALLGGDAKDIQKIEVDKRVQLDRKASKDASVDVRKQNAQSFSEVGSDPLDTQNITMVAPMDLLAFQRPGVQHGVYKNLRLGKYSIDATLDLHRMSVEDARSELYTFVKDCLANDIRTALITHGKGEGRETPALLKSCVAHWLPQIDEVLGFHTAQRHHGSYGATYVLLKKSERKKQKTKEKLTRG